MRGLLDRGRATSVTIAVPCRSDEPGLARTLDALSVAAEALRERGHEVFFFVCVNGPAGPAHEAAAAFAAGSERTTVFTLDEAGKAGAWNRLRGGCETDWIAFCDADVEPAPDALASLAESLEGRPDAAVATARLEPKLEGASLVAKAAALPHRFDFGVVRGPLYLLRTEALERMPDGLLLEDAWLSAELGARGAGTVLSVWSAVVRYRPANTLRDYYRERLRTEAGKIQIRADRVRRGVPHTPIARYPWEHFLAELGPREWPLVALNLGVRVVARFMAELAARRGRNVPWTPVASSKSPAAPGSPSGVK
ncbi:MAG: glycosyltransferase family 2 protein [Candidatus Binatia bacterium]|nr:glycosyltransferase family 2 protein [Candidatus Binatia bacterium]